MATSPKHPPSKTWECCPCRETYFSKTLKPCPICGQPLTERPVGAEPYGRPLTDEDFPLEEADLAL